MLSKNKIKFIQSLELKKYRNQSGCFLAEGNKLVGDSIDRFDCVYLIATDNWIEQHPEVKAEEIIVTNREEIKKVSLMKTPQEVIAVFRKPTYRFDPKTIENNLTLALDTIQDPGNLGTIIRLADWFGIQHVICSKTCADIYSPKVVQATMGALARVKTHYTDLDEWFATITKTPIYGTFLNGTNIYDQPLTSTGIIVMGNEGNGISPKLERYVTRKLYIPNYPNGKETSESLNVAIATAIICAEFRRPRSC